MDKKGIFVFLAVVIALSFAVQLVTWVASSILPLYILLIAPVAGAVAARKASPRPDEVKSAIWPLPKTLAVRIALVTPLIYIAVFAITSVAGWTRPDWAMQEAMTRIGADPGGPAAAAKAMPLFPYIMLVVGFMLTMLLGATVAAAAALGIEYGWRGYLLPRLMPLGRAKAYTAVGIAWGVSMAPWLDLMPGAPLALRFALLLAMSVAVSFLLGEMWRKTRHIGLTAFFCGCFVAHSSNIWLFVFPDDATTFPWGGAFGVVSVAAWAIVAARPEFFFGDPADEPQFSALARAGD